MENNQIDVDAPLQVIPAIQVPVVHDPVWLVRSHQRQLCDSIYAEHLLSNNTFLQYLIQSDHSGAHAPTVQDQGMFRPRMTEEQIIQLFQDVQDGNGRQELQNMFLNYGFIVIIDEWEHALVYVGNDPTMFTNWLNDYQAVTSSAAFFTEQFGN